jgi:hypothetical protein
VLLPVAMPLPTNDGTVLLDVTLHRNDQRRHWLIHSRHDLDWDCRVIGPGFVGAFGCHTDHLAVQQKDKWVAEIDAARAEGWS